MLAIDLQSQFSCIELFTLNNLTCVRVKENWILLLERLLLLSNKRTMDGGWASTKLVKPVYSLAIKHDHTNIIPTIPYIGWFEFHYVELIAWPLPPITVKKRVKVMKTVKKIGLKPNPLKEQLKNAASKVCSRVFFAYK
jgi:hypothetical protein